MGVTAISAGAEHSCAIQNGRIRCWGSNGSGRLGDMTDRADSAIPVQVFGVGEPVLPPEITRTVFFVIAGTTAVGVIEARVSEGNRIIEL